METILNFIFKYPWFTIVGAITFVQITPIKINPWSWIGKQIRKVLVGDIEKTIKDIQKEFADEKINNKRWQVLNFANSCRQGRLHTKEEWEHCLEELKWYESYCVQHSIPNGVMEESAKYLRTRYHDHLHNNDFLV